MSASGATVGPTVSDQETDRPPAVIVGAGPAGISAALWLRRLHVGVRLLERSTAVGGALRRVNLPIEDYPGLRVPNGRALAERFAEHLRAAAVTVEHGVVVHAVDFHRRRLTTSLGDLPYAALVVATGLRRRRLDVPGEDEHRGRGISYSATTDLDAIAGHVAVVVGGGDGAYENAAILSSVCPAVTIVLRGNAPRARPALVERSLLAPNVTTLANTRVLRVDSDGGSVRGLQVVGPKGEGLLPADWVVVKIGFEPRSGFLAGELARDGRGYIRVDRGMRASIPGVFAAGDVANPLAPSVTAAVGDGGVAARSVLDYLTSASPE